MHMKVMIVVGARPNFMKAAPLIRAINSYSAGLTGSNPSPGGEVLSGAIQTVLVHTGQHFDALMSDSFFADLSLPAPDIHLGVSSGSHARQTAEIMTKFEEALLGEQPDLLVVVGDVNSTVACALVASKISFDGSGRRPLIAHIEAGLRSFDRTMPEEINRIVTDQLSDLLFVTEESGLRNLASEGMPAEKVHFAGNTMIDSLAAGKDRAKASPILDLLGLGGVAPDGSPRRSIAPYALLTLHRPSNVDHRDSLLNVVDGLRELTRKVPVIFPVHPRTRNRIREFGLEHKFAAGDHQPGSNRPNPQNQRVVVRMIDPLGYLDFLCLMMHAKLVITDSGGIQEETTCLGVPCVTVRDNTERPITVEMGTNVLAGTSKEGIRNSIRRQLNSKNGHCLPKGWDGKAATRIVDVLIRACRERSDGNRETSRNRPCGKVADVAGTLCL
ncbi:MAG: non-hydrolyzing UDP-N-acetylglucosamine 2-epimerase [Terriglobia bacterium]